MTEIIVQRKGSDLQPCTQFDEALILDLSEGKYYTITPKLPRSWRQNRYYHAMLDLAAENHDYYSKAPRKLRDWIKVEIGLIEEVQFHNGNVHFKLGSTSFQKMDGGEFREFMDRAIDVILERLLVGTARAAFIKEVNSRTGDSLNAIETHMGSRPDRVRQ